MQPEEPDHYGGKKIRPVTASGSSEYGKLDWVCGLAVHSTAKGDLPTDKARILYLLL